MKSKNSKKKDQKGPFSVTYSLEKKSGITERRTYKDISSFQILAPLELSNQVSMVEFTSNQLEEVGDKITITVRKTGAGKAGELQAQKPKELVQTLKKYEKTLPMETAAASCFVPQDTNTMEASSDTCETSKDVNNTYVRAEKKRRLSSGSTENLVQGKVIGHNNAAKKKKSVTIGNSQSPNGSTTTMKTQSLSSMISDTTQNQSGDKSNGTLDSLIDSHSKSKQKEHTESSSAISSSSPVTTHQSSSWESGPGPASTNTKKKLSCEESIEQSNSESNPEESMNSSELSSSLENLSLEHADIPTIRKAARISTPEWEALSDTERTDIIDQWMEIMADDTEPISDDDVDMEEYEGSESGESSIDY